MILWFWRENIILWFCRERFYGFSGEKIIFSINGKCVFAVLLEMHFCNSDQKIHFCGFNENMFFFSF